VGATINRILIRNQKQKRQENRSSASGGVLPFGGRRIKKNVFATHQSFSDSLSLEDLKIVSSYSYEEEIHF
jgi:hypothetical protein